MDTPLRAGVLIAPFIVLILVFLTGWVGYAPELVRVAEATSAWVAGTLGWAFIAVGLVVLILTAIGCFRLDTARIGGTQTRPGYGSFTAIAIGVAASTSLGLLFWASAEPVFHVHQPPRSLGVLPLSEDAQLFARVATFLHWAVIAHMLNALCMVVFGLTSQNLGRPQTFDGAVFRREQPRPIGSAFDSCIVLFATLTAVGAFASCILALSGEMTRFGPLGPNSAALFALALAMVFVVFVAGARPIRTLYSVLARGGLILMIAMMVAAVVLGPSGAIIGGGLRAMWQMLLSLPFITTFTGLSSGDPWPQTWTATHWGSAMMLAPLIGLFLSRAARGFKVGQAVLLFSVIPAAITMLWITVFGGLALSVDADTGGAIWAAISRGGADDAAYAVLWSLPGGESLVVAFVFLIAIAFATFAAAMLHAVMRICAPGREDDPEVGGARGTIASVWCFGLGAAGWGLASLGQGPVADALARLGALPALIITTGLLFALVRICARPRLLHTVAPPAPIQIDLDLGGVMQRDQFADEPLDDTGPPRRRKRRKSA